MGSALFLLAACPSTDRILPSLEGAEPSSIPASAAFDIALLGQGFALEELSFDLDEQRGNVDTSRLSIRLLGPQGFRFVVEPDLVDVRSPRRIELRVRLEREAPVGTFGAQLRSLDRTLAEASALFEVVQPLGNIGSSDLGERDAGGPGDLGSDSGLDANLGTDTGTFDLGPSDAGGSPFFGSYGFRSALELDLEDPIPAGVTLRIPIPHADWVSAGQSRADAADIVILQGRTPMAFQWEDSRAIGTNALVMVVAVAQLLEPPGRLTAYFGDPQAENQPSDSVFGFSERFSAPLRPIDEGNPSAWFQTSAWEHCAFEQSVDRPLPAGAQPGAYCVFDRINGSVVRHTLSTPVLSGLVPLPLGQVFEMRVWLAGRTVDDVADVLYFSHGPENGPLIPTEVLPRAAWAGRIPNAPLAFTDIDDQMRSVEGWRFDPNRIEWWTESIARFSIRRAGGRSMHLRYISTEARTNPDSFVAVDDWTLRIALDPPPRVRFGPVEAR